MIALSSTTDVVRRLANARDVQVLAYTLRRGAMRSALEAAAANGSRVKVRLEGSPYADPNGSLARENRRIVDEMSAYGIEAKLAHVGTGAAGEPAVHAKAIVADGQLFLDDRNWGPADFVVADDDPDDARTVAAAIDGKIGKNRDVPFAIAKRQALAREAGLLRAADATGRPIVESETFGYANPVYEALDELAKRGSAPRLLVSSREAKNRREKVALKRLAGDGAEVRICRDSEKFALVGHRAWIGSANASPVFGTVDMIDWGICTDDAATVAAARMRVEERWSSAKPFRG